MYRLSVTGWGPINIHDPDCAGLIADMYPSGYPGPVDQDFALGMFNHLITLVSEYYFLNASNDFSAFHPCPTTFATQEFVQGSCVKLVHSSYTTSEPVIVLDPFFKLAWCRYYCCTTIRKHCFDTENNTVQTVAPPYSGPPIGCDDQDLIAPPPSGTILSTTCQPMCP